MENTISQLPDIIMPPQTAAPKTSAPKNDSAVQDDNFGSDQNIRADRTSQTQSRSADNNADNSPDDKENFDDVLAKKMSSSDEQKNNNNTDQAQTAEAPTDQPLPPQTTELTQENLLNTEINIAENIVTNDQTPILENPNSGKDMPAKAAVKIIDIPAGNTPAAENSPIIPLTKPAETAVNQNDLPTAMNDVPQPAQTNTLDPEIETKPQETSLPRETPLPRETSLPRETPLPLQTSSTSGDKKAEVELLPNSSDNKILADQQPKTIEDIPKQTPELAPQVKPETQNVTTDTVKQTEVVTEIADHLPKTPANDKFDKSISTFNKNAAANINSSPETGINVLPVEGVAKPDLDINKNQQSAIKTEKTQAVTQTQTAALNSADIQPDSVSAASAKADSKMQTASTVINQVTQEIQASLGAGRDQISIALDPPELGKVMIRFQQTGGEIVGIVETDKVQTRKEIADEMPAIIRSLEQNGVTVKKVEVVLTEEGRQEASRNNSANDQYNTGREGFDDSQTSDNNPNTNTPNRYLGKEYQTGGNIDNYENHISDEAINVYI